MINEIPNKTDFVLVPDGFAVYMSVSVHDHIMNSVLTVFIMAFLLGFSFGFFSDEIRQWIKIKGQK